jgi:glycerophosphoryl diester phosphodiesterase
VTIAIAHRGDPGSATENTLRSFQMAVARGAHMIELDCQVTADARVVVLHDKSLRRLWGVDASVSSLTLAEVAAVGHDSNRIPELVEVLEIVKTDIMVDVADPRVMPEVLGEVRSAGALERCVFAGHVRALEWVRDRQSDARIALTWARQRRPSHALLDSIRPELFNPRWDLASDAVIEAMHRYGCGVSAWTVDDAATMRELIARGVDALITNRIGDLLALLGDNCDAAGQPRFEGEADGM